MSLDFLETPWHQVVVINPNVKDFSRNPMRLSMKVPVKVPCPTMNLVPFPDRKMTENDMLPHDSGFMVAVWVNLIESIIKLLVVAKELLVMVPSDQDDVTIQPANDIDRIVCVTALNVKVADVVYRIAWANDRVPVSDHLLAHFLDRPERAPLRVPLHDALVVEMRVAHEPSVTHNQTIRSEPYERYDTSKLF